MKKKTKTKSIEDAIIQKYPDVTIHEIRYDKFGTRVLATVPARDEFDKDHIVEWTDKGYATECYIDGRDFREVGWDEDEQKPIYVHTKMLLHNDTFDIKVDATD